MLFYLNYLQRDIYRCYEIIKLYYNTIHKYNLKEKNLDSIHYADKKHILLALLCHLNLSEEEIQNRIIFKKFDNKFTKQQQDFNAQKTIPLYKTLIHKRLYKISPLIGLFVLNRDDINDIDYKDILRLYWDYFAYKTPLWKERIDKYNGKQSKDYSLTFKSEDDYEDFYEKYNYEPDEQSQETQDKSIGDIDKKMDYSGSILLLKMETMSGSI